MRDRYAYVQSGGLSTTTLVILLAILKVTGILAIDWWVVFLPWLISIGLLVLITLIVVLVLVVVFIIELIFG